MVHVDFKMSLDVFLKNPSRTVTSKSAFHVIFTLNFQKMFDVWVGKKNEIQIMVRYFKEKSSIRNNPLMVHET